MDEEDHCEDSIFVTTLESIQLILITLAHTIYGAIKTLLPYSWLPQKSVENELILITGAASGIGKLLASKFAKLKARLVLIDLNLNGLEETKKSIHDENPNVEISVFQCDLNDKDAIYRVMDEAKSKVGPVDILINNAGIVTGKKILECPDDLMIKTMNVNIVAHFWTTKSVLPSMLERNHGHIVTLASAGGLTGTAGLVDYCASKFAAVGFTESLALELRNQRKTGIFTTTVCPFYINTGMFHGATTRFPSLLPILEPEYVAETTVNAVLTNQEFLVMPKILYFASYIKSFLPAAASYRIADFLGITAGMDEFIGRHHHHHHH